jgi:hypothetical protein
MRPAERLTPEQVKALQAMSGERRLRLAEQLYWTARRLKIAGLRSQHPDWPEDKLKWRGSADLRSCPKLISFSSSSGF